MDSRIGTSIVHICVQSAGMQKGVVPYEGEYCSSYGTEDSTSEREMEPVPSQATETLMGAMNAIMSSLGAMEASMHDRLTSLEKAMGTVLSDMTWVRDDVRGVQGAMEKLADLVYEMRGAHIEVERLREQISLNACMGPTYNATASPEEHVRAPRRGVEDTVHIGDDDDALGNNVVRARAEHSIRETQPHTSNVDPATNIVSSPEEGEGIDWYNETQMTTRLCSPPCAQTRTSMDHDVVDDETQQYEFTSASGEVRTPTPSRTMWADFTAAIRNLPAPVGAGVEREPGWVSTKRARPITGECAGQWSTPAELASANPLGTLNLNLPPEKHVATARYRGMGADATQQENCGTSRGGGRGGRRGRGRGRGPPNVQPRFHATVSLNP